MQKSSKIRKNNLKFVTPELTFQLFLPVPSENFQGLDFDLRYPAGEFETSRRDIALFFLIRELRFLLIFDIFFGFLINFLVFSLIFKKN